MRLKIHINVRRNFSDVLRFVDLHHMTHDGRWLLNGVISRRLSKSLHHVSLHLVNAPKPLVIEGQAFPVYEKTNLKYAIRKLIRRVQ